MKRSTPVERAHGRPRKVPKVTQDELHNIWPNMGIACYLYGGDMTLNSFRVAVESANLCKVSAARCYAAIVRSL